MPDNDLLITHPEFGELRREYERLRTELSMLISERDELINVICTNIENRYMLAVGALEYRAYELECEMLRLKRRLELIRARINRRETPIDAEIERILDAEFEEHRIALEAQLGKMNSALEWDRSEFLSGEEFRELKRLYRLVVRALHPDLDPKPTDQRLELFRNAVTAYENGDLPALRIIAELIGAGESDAPLVESSDAVGFLIAAITRLEELISRINDRIDEIKHDYPYTLKPIVDSPEQTERLRAELSERIERLVELIEYYRAENERLL